MVRRFVLVGLVAVVGAAGLTGCLGAPASTEKIQLVESRTVDGWRFDRYRNLAYPCSISGYQTFIIGRKVGSSDAASRPLWVKMRGGGAGWFAPDGKPQPSAANKSEETFDQLLKFDTPGLMASIKSAPQGFRVLLVSMCSHDVHSGNNTSDPNNPNTTPDGKARRTTGLPATKAAIQFTTSRYPTDDYFLHGTSAGGVGAISVGWAMQLQGLPPAGIISDSGVINQAWEAYVAAVGVPGTPGCEKATDDRTSGLTRRIAPELADPLNQPHLLVERRDLTVPLVHIWNTNDLNSCGSTPIECPLPNGSTQTLGASVCRHRPLRDAVAGLDASERSLTLQVCVEGADVATPCDRHVVTTGNFTNTDQSQGLPGNYTALIFDWVVERLADD